MFRPVVGAPENLLNIIIGIRPCAASALIVSFLFLGSITVAGTALSAPQDTTADAVFQAGEELTYNVTYAGINLGQIRLRLSDTVSVSGGRAFHARGLIDSYRSIPFVELHTVYEDCIAPAGYSEWFLSKTKHNTHWIVYSYRFNYPERRVVLEKSFDTAVAVVGRDTLRIDTACQDGLSLFYSARKFLQPGSHARFPSVVSEKKGYANIEVSREREHETIDAIDYPVRLIHAAGSAHFVGVYGLSGDFEGWFSDDAARVPVIAKLKVFIGSIRLELMKWKRDGWAPPRYTTER